MRSFFIELDSYTEAKRAVRYLSSYRIRAVVEKKGSPRGCSFGIRVWESPDRVCRILSETGIHCRENMPPPPPPPPPPHGHHHGFMR